MRALHVIHEPLGLLEQAGPGLPVEAPGAAWRAAFEARGFSDPVRVLSMSQVELLRERLGILQAEIERLEPRLYEVEAAWRRDPGAVPLHFLGAWLVDPAFHDLVFHPGLTRPAAALLGCRRLRLWHDQVFAKPPRHPGRVPWHQDYSYWTRATPEAHVTAHLALDPIDAGNGGIAYLPGSHRGPLLPRVPFDGPGEGALAHLEPDRRSALPEPVIPALAPGEAVFHHSRVLHGSGPNPADRPRRAVVVNFMADGVRAAGGGEPLLRGVAPIPDGAPIRGDHFPVVLDTDRVPQ